MLKGYELGADDYITKPFYMSVFKKIGSTSGTNKKQSDDCCYNDGFLYINFSEMKSSILGSSILFTPLEYRLLNILSKILILY